MTRPHTGLVTVTGVVRLFASEQFSSAVASMEKMHDGVHDTSGFCWQREQDSFQPVEVNESY